MDWREYEAEVLAELQRRYPDTRIKRNVMLAGRHSASPRQIDILIEPLILDSPLRIIVDAKHRSSPIDVNDVESFISMMADVGAHRGLIVSSLGYTKTALARAHGEPNQDLELDILSLDELKKFQGTLAIPYSGLAGVVLPAPFGWIIDAERRQGAVACLYRRGLDLNAAGREKEWMYLNFWTKDETASTIDELLKVQAKTLGAAEVAYLEGPTRSDRKRTAIRRANVPGYPTPEYTGFVEFDDFIFFAVMFSPPELEKRNLRKLREVLRTVFPVHVTHQSSKPEQESGDS